MSVALLSQAKKSECGIAQPSFSTAGDMTDRYARTTVKTRASTNAILVKICDTQTDTQIREGVCRVALQLIKLLTDTRTEQQLHFLSCAIPRFPLSTLCVRKNK